MTSTALFSPVLGILDMLGGSELLVIFLLVLVFFGGEKMPEFARGLGKAIREFRKAASGVEQEFKKALEEEPTRQPPPYAIPTPTILPPNPAPPPPAAGPATPAPLTSNPASAPPPAGAAAPADMDGAQTLPPAPSTPPKPAAPAGEIDAG